jgi:thiol-disulfide isomerase/thioredoxin
MILKRENSKMSKPLNLLLYFGFGFALESALFAQAQKAPTKQVRTAPDKPAHATSPSAQGAPLKTSTTQTKSGVKATAIEFTTKDADGKNFDLKTALASGEGVVINFWASWCTACADEIPELVEFQKKYPKYGYYGLNVGEELSKAQKFVKRNSYPYKVILDPTEAISKKFDVDGLPVTIVISKTGEIIYRGNRPPKNL